MAIYNASYKELILEAEKIPESNKLKKEIYKNPFSESSVKEMINKGYLLTFEESLKYGAMGTCNFEEKIIGISKKENNFERDLTICHELIHAFYGEISHDGFGSSSGFFGENRILVNLLSREIRANPKYLASILNEFKIPSQIYDESSLLAAKIRGDFQKVIPFKENLFSSTAFDYSFFNKDNK